MKKFTVTHISAISVFAVITVFLISYSSRFVNTDCIAADSEGESGALQTTFAERISESEEQKEPSDSTIRKDKSGDAGIGEE